MATDRAAARAARDLRDKLELERRLLSRLRAHHRDVARGVVRELGLVGEVPVLASDPLEAILGTHYQAVAEDFSGRTGTEPTEEERREAAAILLLLLQNRAREQARIVTGTTQRDAGEVLLQAREAVEAEGGAFTRLEIATVAGALLDRRLRAREPGIALLETQAPAEATKATEAAVILGPAGARGSEKEWVSQGDDRVRPAHQEADSQRVPVSEAFEVDGEQLMYPGDVSLGASAENVINCRCSAQYGELL